MANKPQRFRFQHLVDLGADESNQPWMTGGGSRGFFDGDDDFAEPGPEAIESQNGQATLAQLEVLLKTHKLSRNDLVDFGRGWQCIIDTPELTELAETLREPRRPMALLNKYKFAYIALGFLFLVTATVAPPGRGLTAIVVRMSPAALWLGFFIWLKFIRRKHKDSVSEKPFELPRDL